MSDCRCVSMSPSWWWWSHQLCVGCSDGSRGAIWWSVESVGTRGRGEISTWAPQWHRVSGGASVSVTSLLWHCHTSLCDKCDVNILLLCDTVTLWCDVMTGRVSLSCFGYRLLQCEYQYANDGNGCFTILWGNGIVVSLQSWEITVLC